MPPLPRKPSQTAPVNHIFSLPIAVTVAPKVAQGTAHFNLWEKVNVDFIRHSDRNKTSSDKKHGDISEELMVQQRRQVHQK